MFAYHCKQIVDGWNSPDLPWTHIWFYLPLCSATVLENQCGRDVHIARGGEKEEAVVSKEGN